MYACIYKTPPIVHEKAEIDATKGQGLESTKWNGCLWRVLDTVDNVVIYFRIELCFLIFCQNEFNKLVILRVDELFTWKIR